MSFFASERCQTTPWVAYYRPRAAPRLRLFCFPFAGGGASSYRGWSDEMPSDIEVVPVQLPGREDRLREKPLQRMKDLVDRLIEALSPLMRDLPFAFFGHSMGAIVALEVARRLATIDGPVPCHMITSARAAPHLPLRRPQVFNLSRKELERWLRELNGTPEVVLNSTEMMDLVLPALRCDLQIDDTFRTTAEPPIACPLTVVGGLRDNEATPDELRGWSLYTSDSFALRLVDGDHFFPFNESRLHAFRILTEVLSATGAH
jgi:surfactin synthase thioesterase subunit